MKEQRAQNRSLIIVHKCAISFASFKIVSLFSIMHSPSFSVILVLEKILNLVLKIQNSIQVSNTIPFNPSEGMASQ